MITPWSSETSWIISRGSIDSVVTFESFDFPIDSESTIRKRPLLLLPHSSSDFEPCEIKLNFTQKHEILQVYVRSTAHVYEIYYSPTLQSDNEYLCTVRCSVASVDDNSFPANDVKEAISVNSEGTNDILPKSKGLGENKIGANEDDWVEVKLPVGQDQKSNNSRIHQDFYEATAEINDSEPCISLTIRLLSLQTKGCVYVDEVYVFADPIDSSDSVSQTVNSENSVGSSLMTMLVPTLLGLTKSRSIQVPDKNHSNPVVKPIITELEPTTSELSEIKAELTRSQLPVSTPDKDKICDGTTRNEFSYTRTEILLEQLVARVSRIEDICMRFEENMLKPINNMEARLERVEQQVELLARCPVSPAFSKREPEPSSIRKDDNDSLLCGEPELEKTESFSSGTHEPHEDASCDEKVEVSDVLESPKEKPKKTVSIGDALAAALAGFSSFTKPNDRFTVESVESIDTAHVSNTDGEKEAEAESLKATSPQFIEDNGVGPTYNVSTEILDNIFDEEVTGPTGDFSCPSSPHETDAQQESVKAVKMLTFDKTDILKHFPDQLQDVSESRVDFESPILEVKFASFDNGVLKSPLEVLWTNDAGPATDEVVMVDERFEPANNLLVDLDGDDATRPATEPANNILVDLDGDDEAARPVTDDGLLVEEQFEPANNLLVDLDGDDVSEDVQQDLPPVELETSFASLI